MPIAVAPDPAAAHRDAVHTRAGDPDATIVAGTESPLSRVTPVRSILVPGAVATMMPRSVGIRDPVAAGADLHVAAHLGAWLLKPGTGDPTAEPHRGRGSARYGRRASWQATEIGSSWSHRIAPLPQVGSRLGKGGTLIVEDRCGQHPVGPGLECLGQMRQAARRHPRR